MDLTRTIAVGGRPLAGGRLPAVCVPLVERTADGLLAEAAAVAALGPDLVEWRADHFEGLGSPSEVVALAHRLRAAVRPAPLLFTRRWSGEGGRPLAVDEDAVVALYAAVCAAGACDLVDYELAHPTARWAAVRRASRAAGVGLVGSFHDFGGTPPLEALLDRFRAAEEAGADAAKVAVLPRCPEDVLRLLEATARARHERGIPVVSMAMGELGAVSRVFGWTFGSCLTFAAGEAASAPGQLPAKALRAILGLLGPSGGTGGR